jgi:hypothetical protein
LVSSVFIKFLSALLLSPDLSAQRLTLRQRVLHLPDAPADFVPLAVAVFRHQAAHNPVYRQYVTARRVRPETVSHLSQIPFLPIQFFKSHPVQTGPVAAGAIEFASSGTTGAQTSRHLVPDPDLYERVSVRLFEAQYGPLSGFHVLALLPSYLERNNSSLVYMVQHFMTESGSDGSGFFLHDLADLSARLTDLLRQSDRKILLIGVTFALLDWAEQLSPDLRALLAQHPDRVVLMETGGMKGRRQELLREEVHALLTTQTDLPRIHSEYGMTELLSQAYSTGNGVFRPGATMRVLLRDINDPFTIYANQADSGRRHTGERRTGGINVIDLANLDSCAFVETQDLGEYAESPDRAEGLFRVIGRFDNSDLRGCNLMVM